MRDNVTQVYYITLVDVCQPWRPPYLVVGRTSSCTASEASYLFRAFDLYAIFRRVEYPSEAVYKTSWAILRGLDCLKMRCSKPEEPEKPLSRQEGGLRLRAR